MLIPFDELLQSHPRPAGVLHLGANTGQEAAMYANLGIPQVIWVEALPSVYERLVDHLDSFPGQIALHACVADKDGQEVAFNISSNGGQSSSMLEPGTHLTAHPEVRFLHKVQLRTVRVDTLLAINGFDFRTKTGWFLNADLQGAELLALKGMDSILRAFNFAYIEVNEKELYKGCALVADIDAYLAESGFKPGATKMTKWGWGDRFYTR